MVRKMLRQSKQSIEDEIVKAILDDLRDRCGFSDLWKFTSKRVRREIRTEWKKLIKSILQKRKEQNNETVQDG